MVYCGPAKLFCKIAGREGCQLDLRFCYWMFGAGSGGWWLCTSVGRVLIVPCSWIWWSLAPHKPGMMVHVHKLNPGEVRQMDQKFKITLD